MKIQVRGHSDDIIEVEQIGGGFAEEYYPSGDKPSYLAFGDGTVLSVEYGKDGMWRIRILRQGAALWVRIDATDPDKDYSDTVTLEGSGLDWVIFGEHFDKLRV